MSTSVRTRLGIQVRDRILEILSNEDLLGKGKVDIHSVSRGPLPGQISLIAAWPGEEPKSFTLTIQEEEP